MPFVQQPPCYSEPFFDVYAQVGARYTLPLQRNRLRIATLIEASRRRRCLELIESLFGPKRKLYKRLAEFSLFQQPKLYTRLCRQPYDWLVACAEHTATALSKRLGKRVAPHELIIDAPHRSSWKFSSRSISITPRKIATDLWAKSLPLSAHWPLTSLTTLSNEFAYLESPRLLRLRRHIDICDVIAESLEDMA